MWSSSIFLQSPKIDHLASGSGLVLLFEARAKFNNTGEQTMTDTIQSEIIISRQIRKSIAQFPDDAAPAETLIFKMSTLSAIGSMTNKKLKQFLTPLVKAL